ncbi:hypothetical protein EV421DRAFT_1912612 [Armillaria borealis]|uniref:Uncharacterized protein n=1 Tax=Armillaria borealis TaxID=47425 RepID=A0AA39MED7_9AGAR|nr:hypothetical protein EV421DRAFT_1912612 [Armillaria borealis]
MYFFRDHNLNVLNTSRQDLVHGMFIGLNKPTAAHSMAVSYHQDISYQDPFNTPIPNFKHFVISLDALGMLKFFDQSHRWRTYALGVSNKDKWYGDFKQEQPFPIIEEEEIEWKNKGSRVRSIEGEVQPFVVDFTGWKARPISISAAQDLLWSCDFEEATTIKGEKQLILHRHWLLQSREEDLLPGASLKAISERMAPYYTPLSKIWERFVFAYAPSVATPPPHASLPTSEEHHFPFLEYCVPRPEFITEFVYPEHDLPRLGPSYWDSLLPSDLLKSIVIEISSTPSPLSSVSIEERSYQVLNGFSPDFNVEEDCDFVVHQMETTVPGRKAPFPSPQYELALANWGAYCANGDELVSLPNDKGMCYDFSIFLSYQSIDLIWILSHLISMLIQATIVTHPHLRNPGALHHT